jgi:PAS domain-containing protein
MGTLHNLTLRTATAVGRLAELQRRAERLNEKPSAVARSALQELSTALEELQVANEALAAQLNELNDIRAESERAHSAMNEFAQTLPVAAVWTDHAGVIEKGNEMASQLLNIGKHHLPGKPLMLFVTDRGTLFTALRTLCEGENVPSVDVEITLRPRERRPRKLKLSGRRLQHDTRCVWFLLDTSEQAPIDIHE